MDLIQKSFSHYLLPKAENKPVEKILDDLVIGSIVPIVFTQQVDLVLTGFAV